ncbi:MAG: LLM class flavin-dependent oxidoreductase [Acidimicrobiales bacterium]|nr:LLM class flavin-dependent oxidoreductase [Acidimicrobiales bacterium]
MARFNLIDPEGDPSSFSDRYKAMLEMATYCDQNGFVGITVEEHHGAENGWSPTPLLNAGMILARTQNLGVIVSALLVPLHDPVRIAEDIAVIDLASGGRLTVIAGIGYRPAEYHLHRKDWAERGRIMDECIDTMLKAWTGEPFDYHGEQVVVRPRPLTQPHPPFMLGGTSKVAARRAARFGLPLFPAAHMPELEAYYYEQCAEHGTEGFCMMPGEETVMLHVAEDPDEAWARLGHHFFHEANTYASWQTPDIKSAVHSHASTPEELRAEGIYQVLTPAECVARAKEQGELAAFNLHPLVGGMPIDEGWKCLQLMVDDVLPHV